MSLFAQPAFCSAALPLAARVGAPHPPPQFWRLGEQGSARVQLGWPGPGEEGGLGEVKAASSGALTVRGPKPTPAAEGVLPAALFRLWCGPGCGWGLLLS